MVRYQIQCTLQMDRGKWGFIFNRARAPLAMAAEAARPRAPGPSARRPKAAGLAQCLY